MRGLIALSIIFALILSVVPLSFEWRWWRPEFMALVVIYWCMCTPQYFGTFLAWSCGLLQDVVELSPLGYNALGLLVVAYLSRLSYQRILSYALWQQAVWVFVLVGVYQLFCHWVSGFMDRGVESPVFLVTAMVSALLWPLMVLGVSNIERRLHLT